ncbi:MAG: phage baseplate assembly protein V [Saprospiraceae bacterium]
MPDSPAINADSILSTEILINGTTINDSYNLVSISIKRAVSSIGNAELVFALSLSDDIPDSGESNDFALGSMLEIQAGYDSKNTSLFKGIIFQQRMRSREGGSVEMIVQCSDEAIQLTRGRQSQYYREMKDSEVISRIVGEHSPLSSAVESTTNTHHQLIQFQSSDWDFILARAAANGLLVYTDGAKVIVRKRSQDESPVISLEFGRDVISFDWALDTRTQKAGVSSKANLSALRGNVKTFGSALPRLNAPVKLSGFGDRIKGDALVASIHHKISGGIWSTTLGFGFPADQNTTPASFTTSVAGGLLPSVNGLQNGTVKQIDQDPEGEYRILVEVPVFDQSGEGIWARFAQFYAGADAGSFFLPELGDEVILGFLNDDPQYPVILGMMYSRKNKPPYAPDAQNKIKGIVTRNKLSLSFDDENKELTIQTPGRNTFILSDRDKSVRLEHQNGHSLIMDSSGITLKSRSDLVIEANGKIELKANGDLSATAGIDLHLKGLNVEAAAQVGFSAQGQATAELKASGQTTVKGAIVMIN